MKASSVGLSASLQPRLVKPKVARVRHFGIPGLGRIAFTRDQGEAELFSGHFLRSRLRAVVRDQSGRLVEERDLGSGLVTNVGVLALAYDTQLSLEAKAKAPFGLMANLAYHQWGSKETAAATTDVKLTKAETNKNTGNANKAVKHTTGTVTASGTGAPKFVSTAKLEAESTLEIKEWGIFNQELLEATTGTPLVSVTATSGKATGTSLTATTDEIKGERMKILEASEATAIWGLITKNTTSEVTVPAWYKVSNGEVKEPTGTSPYTLRPVMFDHRAFSVINVVSGNTIEFPYELTVNSGG